MKKIWIGCVLFASLLSCDDGDVEVQVIDFDSVQPQKCSDTNLLYKFNSTDALLFNISSASVFATAFENDVTPSGSPRMVTISTGDNKVIYRAYDGVVAAGNFCGTILNASPNITEEWKALSGTAQIVTTTLKTTNASTGFEKITKYNHSIVLKNIVFQKPVGTQTVETLNFGSYQTSATSLPFGFDEEDLAKSTCTTNDTRLFNINANEVLHLDLDATTYASLIQSSVTTTPRTALLNGSNKLYYQLFDSIVTNAYYCGTTTPTSPTEIEQWISANGVSGVSGIIEVSTTTSGSQFQHTVHLKNVSLVKDNSSFSLGTNFVLGYFYTN